jgi:hypothetical protein
MKMNSVRKIALLVLALPLLAIGYTLIRPASADTTSEAIKQCEEKAKKCDKDCRQFGGGQPCHSRCLKDYRDCMDDIASR